MSEREPVGEHAEELRSLAAAIGEAAGLLLGTALTAEQRALAERIRAHGEALAGIASARPPASPAPAADERPAVLLVEDNAVNQRVGRVMLEKRGFRADLASDGHEAVAATARAAYAAVLMDCHMPRLDGYGATREIRLRDAGKARVPIIAMTANAGEGARERCFGAGMDDFISKPVTTEALDEVLRRWVPAYQPGGPRWGPRHDDLSPPSSGATPPSSEPTITPRPHRPPSSPGLRVPSVIDLGMLHSLRATQRPGDPDIVAEVIAIFLADAPVRLAALREAVKKGDLAAAGRTAHTLKGSAGHLGAKTLVALCTRFEDKARAGAVDSARFAVEAIEEELGRVRAALSTEAGRAVR
jgi:CheY-like chemotaxis protein/HPt (histidine-containing phosphotransfer) domain-containing protein